MLKDGADSVGLLGALNRVYLNIGLFSEEWLLHFNPIVGGKTITPIRVADAQKNSPYWLATELGTPATALFFLKAAQPDRLADAPGGAAFMTADAATLAHGKDVFADTCARCHSSKAPPAPVALDPTRCDGAGYVDCFNRYWSWTQTDDFKSADARHRRGAGLPRRQLPVDRCARAGHAVADERLQPARDQCASPATSGTTSRRETYKNLPSVGTVTIFDPFDGKAMPYAMPAGGRGYTRVPTLDQRVVDGAVPAEQLGRRLQRRSVGRGPHEGVRPVDRQMLWPDHRKHDAVLGDKVPGVIDRTTQRSSITIPTGFVPESLRPLQNWTHRTFPFLGDDAGGVVLGPIPQGVPIGLLANTKLRAESDDVGDKARQIAGVGDLLLRFKLDLLTLPPDASDAQLRAKFANIAAPLMALSKCPDFVVNRGHYFGTAEFNRQDGLSADERSWGREPELNDDDKRALIAFIKTF